MHRPLRARMINASLWTTGGFAAQKVFQLGSNLVLTRLLFPEAFGLMALANVVLIGLQMFSDVGIKPAIVQNDRDDDAFLNTAWTIQVVRGFTLWAVACLLAFPASLLYHNAVLWPLISALGATAAISGFSSISLATAERRLMVKQLTLVQLAGQAVQLTLTAAMAWWLKSVWALAYGGIAGALVSTAFSHVFLPHHRHAFAWQPSALQALVRFGRWIFLATAVTFLGGQGLRALQGIFLTPAQLGILAIAQTIAWIPGELMMQVTNMVGFPALSELRKDSFERMVGALTSMRGKILLVAMPMFLTVVVFAQFAINLLYDHRYHEAGRFVAFVALAKMVDTIPLGYQNAVIAIGNTRLHFWLMVTAVSANIIGMVIGFRLNGIDGMLIGIFVGSLANAMVVAFTAHRLRMFTIGYDALALAAIGVTTATAFALHT